MAACCKSTASITTIYNRGIGIITFEVIGVYHRKFMKTCLVVDGTMPCFGDKETQEKPQESNIETCLIESRSPATSAFHSSHPPSPPHP